MDKLLTPKQTAERLGMSLKFVQKHIASRRLPGLVKCGRAWRINPTGLEKAIISGKILNSE